MGKVYVEQRVLGPRLTLSSDMARHTYTRCLQGGIAVVTERPSSTLPAFAKQWRKVILNLQRERARTIDPRRTRELTRQIAYTRALGLATADRPTASLAGIVFGNAEHLTGFLRDRHTVYVTSAADTTLIESIADLLPPHALIVTYEYDTP